MINYQFSIIIFLSSFSIIFLSTKSKDKGLTYSLSILALISLNRARVSMSILNDEYAIIFYKSSNYKPLQLYAKMKNH